MKNNKLFYLALLFLIACETNTAKKSDQSTRDQAALAGSMQGLKAALSNLLPMVIDSQQFNAPENRESIKESVDSLFAVSKQVVHNEAVQHMDPSLRFISSAFSEDIKRAKESIDSGQREFARYTLMNVTAYCIECHTRTSSGPSFSTPQLEKTLTSMRKLDRGEFLLATRRFDQALQEFSAVIKEGLDEKGNIFDLDRAIRHSLAITIRFQKNPKKSLEIVNMVSESKNAPFFLKQSATSWAIAIKAWSKEKPLKANLNKESGISEYLKQIDLLVQAGRKVQFGFADRGGDVYFLRSLSDLHLLFEKQMSRDQLGQALFLTAVSYEAVRDLAVWSLHENYYESCIRQVPHSYWSERCYKNLEDSVYFGFTGSSGVRLPVEVQIKLSELKTMALQPSTKSN